MDTEFSRRLAAALSERGATQAGLAQHAGVNPSTVSHWVTGRREPDLDTINAVAGFLRVNPAWLAFGEGAMSADDAAPPAADANATQIDGTPSHGRKPAARAARGSTSQRDDDDAPASDLTVEREGFDQRAEGAAA